MQLQVSNKVGRCGSSVCNLRPACFANCNSFFVDYLVIFIAKRNYLWYHFANWRVVACCSSVVVLQCACLDAVESNQRGTTVIGCRAGSARALCMHTGGAHFFTDADTLRAARPCEHFFSPRFSWEVASLLESKGASPSEVTSH